DAGAEAEDGEADRVHATWGLRVGRQRVMIAASGLDLVVQLFGRTDQVQGSPVVGSKKSPVSITGLSTSTLA
ncbi:MAG: hypothetical protein KDB35_23765, partial [Acidimicrobiales bacterium]|nr:hypothetical protein [Acidimicrobiales bacterium]